MIVGVQNGGYENTELANWLKSFEGVYKRLLKVVCQEGVQPIESVGQPVDLDCHEVVEVCHEEKGAPGTVVKEEQKGYLIENRVLRDARVVVAKPKSDEVKPGSTNSAPREEGA